MTVHIHEKHQNSRAKMSKCKTFHGNIPSDTSVLLPLQQAAPNEAKEIEADEAPTGTKLH